MNQLTGFVLRIVIYKRWNYINPCVRNYQIMSNNYEAFLPSGNFFLGSLHIAREIMKVLYFDVLMLYLTKSFTINWAWNICKECSDDELFHCLRLDKATCFSDKNSDLIFWTIPMPSSSLTGITTLAIPIVSVQDMTCVIKLGLQL